jgi:hypothetical protein
MEKWRTSTNHFIIAVKRPYRRAVEPDWAQRLARIDGLDITGDIGELRLQVRATHEAIEEVRQRLGEAFHIEPVISHDRLDEE